MERKLLVILAFIGLAGCATDGDTYLTENGCTVTQEEDGQFITCNDQSFFIPVHNYIKDVVDPCGDGPGPDEVLFVFDDGSYIAWYKNLGLVNLEPRKRYVTTDAQQCIFEIGYNGEIWYE